jgi:hypothetical protein
MSTIYGKPFAIPEVASVPIGPKTYTSYTKNND